MTLILISCINGRILSSLINQDKNTINTFEELVDYNYSIIGGKWSYFSGFDRKRSGYEFLNVLHNRSEFVNDYDVRKIYRVIGK